MVNRKRKSVPFSNDLRSNTGSILGIILALFLFLLFFQPLDPQFTEFNPKLLIISTFAAITLFFLYLFRVFIPLIFRKLFLPKKWNLLRVAILSTLFVSFNSVAYTFFARYVGKIDITFQIEIKIILLSIAPVAALLIISQYKYLKVHLQNLIELRPNSIEVEQSTRFVNFESENKSEYLKVNPKEIILAKSANNYIEITFAHDSKIIRKLIRSTLRRAEDKLSDFPYFVRCHRICIVNINYVEELIKAHDGYKLRVTNISGEVPVSRQYILRVREALKK